MQAPVPPRIRSLGQPTAWGWLGGVSTGIGAADVPPNAAVPARDELQARLGLYHSIANPVVDALGVSLEAYAGLTDGAAGTGFRARLAIPIYGLAIGADRDLRRGRTDLMYSWRAPLRRGGLLGRGSMLRLDYLPSRARTLYAGLELPLVATIRAGRIRPAHDRVQPEGPLRLSWPRPSSQAVPAAALTALERLRWHAQEITATVVPFLGRAQPHRGAPPPSARPAVDVTAETQAYHRAMREAFAAALDLPVTDAAVEQMAEGARIALREGFLLPYDQALGQSKHPDFARPLQMRARATFAASAPAPGPSALAVFDAVLEAIEDRRVAIETSWRDARFAWLPLQLALLPEEHDSQAELDALLARAAGREWQDGNFVSYVINEQFQYHVSRTIHAAREYHVLWTHDFRGVDDTDHPDEVSYRHVVKSYLAAMTARVRAYDSTGTFPTYLILHDQWYYSVRQGRLFLRFLEDPLRARIRLPAQWKAWSDSIVAAQDELRQAVAASRRLQEGRRTYGEGWLRNLVKVHVSVMNRPDPSYRSWRLVTGLPMTDNIMRDHRKLVFYDIGEDDPYRGEAIFTGAGIGEHYTNDSWEDRSLLVRGPALLNLKDEARRNLLAHRLRPDQIPPPLRPRPKAPTYERRIADAVASPERSTRALSIHNETGYDAKHVNVAKAMLYTLMPPGSVILVPDSFWNAEFWGAALVGASLRGARVLVIAPSYRSNSVEVRGTQLLSRELLWRMLRARDAHAATLAASGGLLQVGIFDSEIPVPDIPGKVSAVRRTFAETPWLRELFGFPDTAYADLARLEATIRRLNMSSPRQRPFEGDPQTRLHLKANHFVSAEAWRIMQRPEWGALTESFVMQRIAQVQSRDESLGDFSATPDAILNVGDGFVESWEASLTPAERERAVFYTMMGSQNQNYRSMVMDAEVALVTSGWPSVIPYLDAIALVGQSRWLLRPDDVDALLPPMGAFITGIAHWARLAF